MIQFQSIANEIRDCLLENDAVRRLRIEVLWVVGNPDALTIRARHRDRVLTVERAAPWHRPSPEQQAAELAHELVGNALDTLRAAPAPPRRRRWADGPDAGHPRQDPRPRPAAPPPARP
jgi:hypothetical protein